MWVTGTASTPPKIRPAMVASMVIICRVVILPPVLSDVDNNL